MYLYCIVFVFCRNMSKKYQVLSWSAEAKLGEVQVQKGHHEDQNVSHLGKDLWLIRVTFRIQNTDMLVLFGQFLLKQILYL